MSKPAPFLERDKNEPIGSAEVRQSVEALRPVPPVPVHPLNAAVSAHAPASSDRRSQRKKVQDAREVKILSGIIELSGKGQKQTDQRINIGQDKVTKVKNCGST